MSKNNLPGRNFIALASLIFTCYSTTGGAALCPPAALAATNPKSADTDGSDPAARALINKGQWNSAIEKLERVTTTDSVPGRNLAWLAFAYLYTGKQDALRELDKKVQSMPASSSDPNAATIIHAFTLTLPGTGKDAANNQARLEEAQKLLNDAKSEDKGDALLEFTRACVALKKGDAKKAAELCQRVLDLSPNFAWGYRTLGFIQEKSLKNTQLADAAYEKALSIEPGLKDARNLLVDMRLAGNNFDGAIASTREAIKSFPGDPDNYYRLALIYQQQWRLIEALQQLQKAISLSKDDARFHRATASIYKYQGKLPEAIAEQQKAVDLSKDKSFELTELSNLQELDQKLPDAIVSMQQAVKESPANQIANQKLVQLLKKAGRTDDLITEFKRELELQPRQASLHMELAEAYKQTGKLDDAVSELKESANLDQQNPNPHREIAKIEIKQKNFAAAAKSYTRALNISLGSRAADSGTVEDLVALGYCYAQNNDYMQSETAFTTAFAMLQLGATTGLQSSINPMDILRSLGSVLLTEGRYREAAVNFEQIVSSDKDGEQKKTDQYTLALCKALRDRNPDSLKELQSAFNELNHAAQLANLESMTDALTRLEKNNLAAETVKAFTESELKTSCPLSLLRVLVAENKGNEARELSRRIIDETKDNQEIVSSAYLELARAMVKDGDKPSAISSLQKAGETNPKDFDCFVDLGRLYLADGKAAESQQYAQKALEVNPYCAQAFLLMGDSFAAMNKLKDAEANFARAAELYPTWLEAHKSLLSVYQKQSKTAEAQREQEIIKNLSHNG